jgi:hypothetical protein
MGVAWGNSNCKLLGCLSLRIPWFGIISQVPAFGNLPTMPDFLEAFKAIHHGGIRSNSEEGDGDPINSRAMIARIVAPLD